MPMTMSARHVDDEEVGGEGEDAPRFTDAAEVAEGEQHHEGDRHGHGQRVVRAGAAEMMASAPAATDTATVIV